jgi:hypothetical protein
LGGEFHFDEADYVITSINAEIRKHMDDDNPTGDIFKCPYNRKRLNSEFTRVFAVRRAYGLEVASIWQRKIRIAQINRPNLFEYVEKIDVGRGNLLGLFDRFRN